MRPWSHCWIASSLSKSLKGEEAFSLIEDRHGFNRSRSSASWNKSWRSRTTLAQLRRMRASQSKDFLFEESQVTC